MSPVQSDPCLLDNHTRPGDLSSVEGKLPPLGWGDWSDPPEDAEDDEEGETPEEMVNCAPVPLVDPLSGALLTQFVGTLDEVGLRMLAAVDGGMTPPRPPSLE